MRLLEICEEAAYLGGQFDLSDCLYGESHITFEPVSKPYKYYHFLAGFCKVIKARNILEIGTYKGGSIKAMNKAVEAQNIVTMDFQLLGELPPNIIRISNRGDSSEIYPALSRIFNSGLDLVFIDAEHTYEVTKGAFENCITLSPRYVIFDDIHLNEEMEQLWDQLNNSYECLDISELSGREDDCDCERCGFGIVYLPK